MSDVAGELFRVHPVKIRLQSCTAHDFEGNGLAEPWFSAYTFKIIMRTDEIN